MAPESIKSAPAPQQGYATDARKADTLVTQKGKSVAQARIEAFRYNDLDRDALRRCICKSIVPNTLEWKALADGLYTNFRSWRSDSVGCSVTMVRKEQWWPLFVSACVEQHDWYALMHNLQREIDLWGFDPPQESARRAAKRVVDRRQYKTLHVSKTNDYKISLNNRIDMLRKEQLECRGFAPEKALIVNHLNSTKAELRILEDWESTYTVPVALGEVKPPKQLYGNLPLTAVSELWGSKWNRHVAFNFYPWAQGYVDIIGCGNEPVMGDLMVRTFNRSAIASWQFVLGPRRCNERWSRNQIAGWEKFSTAEDQEAVGMAFTKAAEKFNQAGGIELVLVPVQTKKSKRRRDTAGFDMEDAAPNPKRIAF